MVSSDADDADVPWGKYTYALEGLAAGCYLEGASETSHTHNGKRLRFRVELPARCFVLSVAIKLPNAPEVALAALQDIEIERTLSNGDYETVYDARAKSSIQDQKVKATIPSGATVENDKGNTLTAESPTAVDQTSGKSNHAVEKLSRKKVMEVRRAADSLRLSITDIDGAPFSSSEQSRRSGDSEDGSDSSEFRTLGVVVVGYVRGQTPAANRIKILLNSSARLGCEVAKADRAEVDGLLGLAFLGNRRYRQAAELLQRASEEIIEVAKEDEKSGFATDDAFLWAAELNLLSAYAYFEHMPMSNDGIVQLILVAASSKLRTMEDEDSRRRSKDSREMRAEFLDLRTELLIMLERLLDMLVNFLAESRSVAVKLASARMIEFVCEQLGCAVAKYLSRILNQVLRLYPESTTFGARERAAAASFSYDSMEDCYERLIDLCCRLFPLMEHGVLHKLYDTTLVPVFLDGFHESKYLTYDADAEEESDELMTTAVAQTLRVIYLVLSLIGADARVPTSLVARVLNILVLEDGNPRTPVLLRRTALHVWDALSEALKNSARGNNIKAFAEHFKVLSGYLPRLLVERSRPNFEYGVLDDDGEGPLKIIKEEYITPNDSQVLEDLLKKKDMRTQIVDRHTLNRVLRLIHDICDLLSSTEEEEERYLGVIISLQKTLGQSIADLVLSSLVDVSYNTATLSGVGSPDDNNVFEYGDMNVQLGVVNDVLEELFDAYWMCISLLPHNQIEDTVKNAPVRSVLGWCVDRMKHSAPPRGMQVILVNALTGLRHELNTPMYGLPPTPETPHEVTFIGIYRAHVQWFAQSNHSEAFDLTDVLLGCVSEDLMAPDIVQLINTLGDQIELYQERTESSLESLANLVAETTPKRPDLAMGSLKELEDPSLGKQRIANGFPKSNRASTGSFSRRMQFSSTPRPDPMSKSLYVHVMLASCFDRFDALARAGKQRAGPSYMGEKIDAFVEHAALCVRCLHVCAKTGVHREYIAAVLGDVFSTCLAMQANGDGRVRLAGFEIFAASLDILFRATVLISARKRMSENGLKAVQTPSATHQGSCAPLEPNSGVSDLLANQDADVNGAKTAANIPIETVEIVRANSLPSSSPPPAKPEAIGDEGEKDDEKDIGEAEKRMQEIFVSGGSCSFQGEDIPPSDLAHEEKGWQMLYSFISSSLSVCKCLDFVVQRACLEYLKGCLLNALCRRATGASVIGFDHIEGLWDSVKQLVGSPWLALNGLAMWVICAIANVSIYSTIMVKGRGAMRQRAGQLHDFAFNQIFPTAETFLKSGTRETRIWGMRLLEAYVRARDLNNSIVQTVPPPPFRILRALDGLRHDYDEDIRECSQSLVEIHYNATNKKAGSSMSSFTAQAQNFMARRYQGNDLDSSESLRIELWFPPLPVSSPNGQMDSYCKTLEGFANAEISGGEETELMTGPDDESYDEEYDEEEEGLDFDDDEKEEGIEHDGDYENAQVEVAKENAAFDEDDEMEDDDFSDLQTEVDGELISADDELDGDDDPFDQEFSKDISEGASMDIKPLGDEEMQPSEAVEVEADDVIDEEEDDREFSSMSTSKLEPEVAASDPVVVTHISDDEEDDRNPIVDNDDKSGSDDDLVDEDEVVNVTDEDDVLADLDTVPAERKLPRVSSAQLGTADSVRVPTRTGSYDSKIRRPSSGPNPDLNPDLKEGMRVVRRLGSFTSRSSSSTAIALAAGEIPKLARRRSVDVPATAIIEATGESRPSPEAISPSSMGSRVSRRRSKQSPAASPRAANMAKSTISESSLGTDSPTQESMSEKPEAPATSPASGIPVRKKSTNTSNVIEAASKEVKPRTPTERLPDSLVDGEALEQAPRSSRVPWGIKLDDEPEDTYEARPVPTPPPQLAPKAGSSERSSIKSRSEKRSSKSARRLPRAPAFVKGGGPQRRMPVPLPIGTPVTEYNASGTKRESSPEGNPNVGSLSSPSLSGPPRPKLPRAKSQSSKISRLGLNGDPESAEKRPDRSHRFSRREPLSLPIVDTDEFDKDLLDDLDGKADAVDDLENQARVGTPTAEAVRGPSSLADDQPSSFKKRGKRDVTDSEHYKSLLDQIGKLDDADSRLSPSAKRESHLKKDGASSSTSKGNGAGE